MNNIEAVIFDWAGTTVDFGSFAPTSIFVEAFKVAYDFDISLAEARGPMGLGKWDHIRALGDNPSIAARWREKMGRTMDDCDVDEIYGTFMPLQIAIVGQHSDLIPETEQVIRGLREKNIKIGSCSGYPREVMNVLIDAAAAKGYQPDHIVASDDLAAGARPGPWMALDNAIALKVKDVAHCIKVDDSTPGITEGLSAGMWTVGLTLSGNASGMTEGQFLRATNEQKEQARRRASVDFKQARAHYIIDTIADLPPVIDDINHRLQRGERP